MASGSSQGHNTRPLCRYFVNGACRYGDSCKQSHDRSAKSDMTCQYYKKGSCGFGDMCRYDHIRPKEDKKKISAPSTSKVKSLPKPKQLGDYGTGFNVNAAEFVPSWKRAAPGTSYSNAAGSIPSMPSENWATLCPYYEETGNCNTENCRYLHGDLCDLCDKYCLHPHIEEQRKEHKSECAKRHELAMEEAFAIARTAEKTCGICMENIHEKELRFGILDGCRHCFCLECIRQWRKNDALEDKVIRSCPECRQHSDFVIPSVMWVEDEEEKKVLLQMYKENTSKKQCKYYKDPTSTGCPFGNKCFYKHQLPDGTIDPGESPKARRPPRLSEFLNNVLSSLVDSEDFDFSDEEDYGEDQWQRIFGTHIGHRRPSH